MKNKQAFTLIELLVVVLIIGILAAVAVPQYKKAVQKARWVQTVTVGDALRNAAQRYVLAAGSIPTALDELDIEVPGTLYETKRCVKQTGKYHCCLGMGGTNGNLKEIYCYDDTGLHVIYRGVYSPEVKISRRCEASINDTVAQQLCQAVGGTNPSNTGNGFLLYAM